MTDEDLKVVKHALAYVSKVVIFGIEHVRVAEVPTDILERMIREIEDNRGGAKAAE